jgi:hypothetical protein
LACEKCIQRWILWVIGFMFIGGLLFFLYWKLEIEPEKNRNCRRDEQGKCVEGGDDGGYDRDNNRRGRAGSKLGYYDDAYVAGFNDAAGSSHGRGGGGGGGANRRMLAAAGAGAGAAGAEEQDTQTFLRYKAQATMLW